MSKLALVGGTSLLECSLFDHAARVAVTTPHGPVTLLEQGGVIFLQRHGLGAYTPPHAINHKANLTALKQAGVTRVLAVGSVGSLQPEIAPGAVVFPDDFIAPHVLLTLFDDARGHRTPGFDVSWRQELLTLWRQSGLPPAREEGVYLQTMGPRFETPAEIRLFQPHAQVVGMTVASECILAGELEIPYAALCMVDNFANGVAATPITFASFKEQVRANEGQVVTAVTTLVNLLRHS